MRGEEYIARLAESERLVRFYFGREERIEGLAEPARRRRVTDEGALAEPWPRERPRGPWPRGRLRGGQTGTAALSGERA